MHTKVRRTSSALGRPRYLFQMPHMPRNRRDNKEKAIHCAYLYSSVLFSRITIKYIHKGLTRNGTQLFNEPTEIRAPASRIAQSRISSDPLLIMQFHLSTITEETCVGKCVHAAVKPYYCLKGSILHFFNVKFDLDTKGAQAKHEKAMKTLAKKIEKCVI